MSKVLVFIEPQEGGLKRNSLEALTAANQIAAGNVTAVAINADDSALSKAGKYGASKVVNIKHKLLGKYSSSAAAKAIKEVADKEGATAIVFSANAKGKELAPIVAVHQNASFVADVMSIEGDANSFTVEKPVYAGKAVAKIKPTKSNKVITLRPNLFTAKETGGSAEVEAFAPNLSEADVKVRVVSESKNQGKLDVAEADKIVSGGRGLKEAGNFNLVEDLAAAVGGAVGASRAVVDAGWRPHGEQVGQTGKTVSPNLYIAVGISGAVQHLAGMSSSKVIVAINKDKDAPIFKIADYGIIGDAFEVVPKLTQKIKALG
ncbi:MAG: electron transfer flavoprotein subunit alpha/FixB family protein [Candidatus Kapaibacteriales bacterium]